MVRPCFKLKIRFSRVAGYVFESGEQERFVGYPHGVMLSLAPIVSLLFPRKHTYWPREMAWYF